MAVMKKLLILLLFIPYLGFSQIKISALTEATTLNANDWFMAVQGGTTKKVAFYRFSYNHDSTALQITDSLAFYVQKTELSDSLLNYILRTELNDSLANYTSLDSLTYYMKTIDVRNAISDSIAGISSVSLGTANQVPFMNVAGSDFIYKDSLEFTGDSMLFPEVVFKVGSNFKWVGNTQTLYIGINKWNLSTSAIRGYPGTTRVPAMFFQTSTYTTPNIFPNGQDSNTGIGQGANDELSLITGGIERMRLKSDTVRINGTLDVTGDIVGGGEIKRRVYEASAYVPEDSTLTTSATTAWQFLGVGANNKFVNIYAEGFSLDGDTLQWTQDPTDLRDSVEFNISWSTSSSCSNNGILVSYGLNIKNDSEPTYTIYNPVTRSTRCATSGQAYSWACTAMPIFLKDGAKIQIVVKASGSTTVTTEDFGIYLKEE
jgi:hypothetical protein